MTPNILIEGTIAAPTTAEFTIVHGPALLFCSGLAGAEVVTLNLSNGAAYFDSKLSLVVATPILTLTSPGQYQVSIASSTGAVKVGIYQKV